MRHANILVTSPELIGRFSELISTGVPLIGSVFRGGGIVVSTFIIRVLTRLTDDYAMAIGELLIIVSSAMRLMGTDKSGLRVRVCESESEAKRRLDVGKEPYPKSGNRKTLSRHRHKVVSPLIASYSPHFYAQ